MKRYVIAIITLLTTLSVVAEHDYIPYLATGKQWVEVGSPGAVMYTITDTVEIEGQQYCCMPSNYLNKDYEAHEVNQYIYEVDKRVYIRRSDKDILLYDFGLQVGDTIETGAEYYCNVLCMDSITTITLNGLERNKYFISVKDKESEYYDYREIWIEGIGCITSATLTISRGTTGACMWRYYYEPETGFIYPEDKTPLDFSAVTTIGADTNSIIRSGDVLSCDGTMVAYSIAGKPMAQGATIDLATLPRGIYIVRATLHDGGVQTVKVVR